MKICSEFTAFFILKQTLFILKQKTLAAAGLIRVLVIVSRYLASPVYSLLLVIQLSTDRLRSYWTEL